MNEYELRRLFPNASASTLKRNAKADGVAAGAEQEPNPGDEPVAKAPRARFNPGFRFVRVTSFRRQLIDERNLWDAYFVDALVRAGVLFNDTPKDCKVDVLQIQVNEEAEERTEICVTPLSASVNTPSR